MSYCSACGSKMEGSERFCANCGEEQQPGVRLTPRRRSPVRKAKRLPLILIPLVLIAVVAGAIVFRPAPVISVPGDYPTIQAAIDAAEDGDVIVVEPGTYRENIDFRGKAITVRSTAPDDPQVVAATIIDGGNNGSVVTFRNGETAESVLSGFTITGGSGTGVLRKGKDGIFGGGILVIYGSSPTITDNTITGNITWDLGGGGIAVIMDSSPTIENNIITGNTAREWGGGGILVLDGSSPTITGNTITDNTACAWGGGGILVMNDSTPTITGNTIAENTAERDGGGILVMNDSTPTITGNTIAENTAEWSGGGILVSRCSTLQLKTPDDNIYRNNIPDDIYQVK